MHRPLGITGIIKKLRMISCFHGDRMAAPNCHWDHRLPPHKVPHIILYLCTFHLIDFHARLRLGLGHDRDHVAAHGAGVGEVVGVDSRAAKARLHARGAVRGRPVQVGLVRKQHCTPQPADISSTPQLQPSLRNLILTGNLP